MAARVLLAAGLLALGGCGDAIHPEFVARRWVNTLSAFNIDAVFPPRHVQVGDVFLMLLPADGRRANDLYARRSLRLGRAEVRRALMADMRTNLLLPPTTGQNPGTNIFDVPDKVLALRPTGYPGFNIAQVTEADLGVSFPVQAFRALFGAASSHELVMSISIPQAEDSELPAYDAYRALVAFCAPSAVERRCEVGADPARPSPEMTLFIDNLCQPDERPGSVLTPWVVFVNHVYYVRRIDYAYTTRGGVALNAAAALATASATADKEAAAGEAESGSGAAAAGGADNRSDAAKLAQALQGKVEATQAQLGAAGGRVRLAYASSEGTLLSQTFETPIAIGYRGLWFKAGAAARYCDLFHDATPRGGGALPE